MSFIDNLDFFLILNECFNISTKTNGRAISKIIVSCYCYYAIMFPIRVVVESVRSGECCRCSYTGNSVIESYAIVNGQTPINQLVDTVLTALGLQQLATAAKGSSIFIVYYYI